MAKLVLLDAAQHELEDIALLHMHLVGADSARRITDRILASLSRLEQFPLSGHIPHDKYLRQLHYRYVIVSPYLCIYRIADDTVYVVHIAHGKTDYPQHFQMIYDDL